LNKSDLQLAGLANSIGYLLRYSNRQAKDATVPILNGNGLSSLGLTTLYLIKENPNCSLKQLANAAYVESPAMNRLLGELENSDLISRKKSLVDARYVIINITNKGLDKVDYVQKLVLDVETKILSTLSKKEKTQLIDTLTKITGIG